MSGFFFGITRQSVGRVTIAIFIKKKKDFTTIPNAKYQ
jgi:hypothetical protein